jgi:hypothetical protein
VVPLPSWPTVLDPQHHAAPEVVRPQAKLLPAVMAANRTELSIAEGGVRGRPATAAPQQRTVPVASSAHVPAFPAAIVDLSPIPGPVIPPPPLVQARKRLAAKTRPSERRKMRVDSVIADEV